jgi:hypothetical protein
MAADTGSIAVSGQSNDELAVAVLAKNAGPALITQEPVTAQFRDSAIGFTVEHNRAGKLTCPHLLQSFDRKR